MSFGLSLLFIIQIIISLLLIFVVMLQSSDEDALSNISSSSSKFGSVSRRSSVDFITKLTMVLGVIMMINSFILVLYSTHKYVKEKNTIKNYLEEKSQNENRNSEEENSEKTENQK